MGKHGRAVGEQKCQVGFVGRAVISVIKRPCDGCDLVDGIAGSLGHSVDIASRSMEFGALCDVRKKEIKEDFAVGVSEDKTLKSRCDALFELFASFAKIGDISVVCKDPISVLEGVGIDDGELALGGFADVCDDGFRRDDARYTAKKNICEGGFRRLDDMRSARDIVPHAPSIGVALTLSHQCVVGVDEAMVDLAFDDGAESK